ncbi:Ger(x)C family spore germination protein [Bacillus sp. SCS-153A]|uniref:Ger(x)C family spore germination protein n=1 Tax=Rossellomorea sedimentorum TaxID=3115294 RepID=UPI0039066682
MRRLSLLMGIIAASLLLSSCVETNYLEKQGLITGIGYDQSEEKDKISGTLVYYQFNPAMKNLSTVITGVGETSKGIRHGANLESDHNLVSGQLRVVLYGEEIAKKGISSLVDTLSRDASIGNMIFLGVGTPTAEEILSFQPKSQPANMGTYLYNLFQANIKNETIPNPTLQEFMTRFGSVGKDAILPQIAIIQDKIGIDGFALFSDDRQVGVLDREKIFYVRSLMDQLKASSAEVELPTEPFEKEIKEAASSTEDEKHQEKLHFMLDNIKSNHKIEVTDKSKPSFNIKLKLESRILEMTVPFNLSEAAVLKKVEDVMAKAMEEKAMKVLKEIQETGSDPIGFGSHYRAISRDTKLTKEMWSEIYPKAEFNLDIEMKIIRTGIID